MQALACEYTHVYVDGIYLKRTGAAPTRTWRSWRRSA